MDTQSVPTGALTGAEEWELIVPDDAILTLAGEIGRALESAGKRLEIADEIKADAEQMSGWFQRKKRDRFLQTAELIRARAADEIKEVTDKTVNYATTSPETAREMEKALSYVALNDLRSGEGEESEKLSKGTTESLAGINQALDSFVKSYGELHREKSVSEEAGEAEEEPKKEDGGEPPSEEAPAEGQEDEGGKGERAELFGNSAQALEELNDALARFKAGAEERLKEGLALLRTVEKHQSQVYLERKKLNASVSDTVGTLERSLTQNKLHHHRLEKNIVELSYRVSQTLDKLQDELRSSVSTLEEKGKESISILHEKVDGHKEEYRENIGSLKSDYGVLKESLDKSDRNFENLSAELRSLSEKLTVLETRNSETTLSLEESVRELKNELTKVPEVKGKQSPNPLLYAWGAFVTIVALAALVLALS
ncbi:MAG: hypothetical protein LBR53_00775 [Deltaproteobacteria bacterium]|jgi:hypothetical protein|nr:hypothetical protein [Deltaproteobacteria bacterium]